MTSLDGAFSDLADEGRLSEARRMAEDQYADLSSLQINHLRRRAKNDLFFLCSGPLEYDLLSPRLHGSLCGWMESTRSHNHRMLLLPRGHFKSTVKTIGEAVQMALPNVADVAEFPYCLGPNAKILLSHEVRESAARFLYEIAAAFMRKPLMLALFPECIPSRRLQRVNKWEFELPREQHHKEPTFDTIGAGGAAQGRHYNWLMLDDLIGEDARDSQTIMSRVLTWFDNVNSLLGPEITDGWDLTGTRWGYTDVYSHAMKRYGIDLESSILGCVPERDQKEFGGGQLAVYARGAIEEGEPIFPEKYPLTRLEVLRKNRLVWAAQYANNPLESGLNEFTWPLKFYNVDMQGNIVVFSGETSFKRRIRDLDVCVLIDPSMGENLGSDDSGIIVTGTDKTFNIFILETVKKRLRPPELISEMFRLYLKYYPRIISIEEVAFSAIYRYWFEEKCRELSIHPSVHSYKPGSKKSKAGRIRGLANFFSAGQVYVSEGMHDFRDEYERFPMSDSEHLLDAFAQGPSVWQRGMQTQDVAEIQKAEAQVLDERSALTGY